MHIAIVDDLDSDRLMLETILREYGTVNGLDLNVSHFDSGEALLRDYAKYRYSLVILDIYMKGMSGVETAKILREKDDDLPILFLSTSGEYTFEAFSVFAVGYLKKPCVKEEVFRVLDHVLHRKTDLSDIFNFTYSKRNYSLRFSEIIMLESQGNYILITALGGETYRTRMTFSQAESMLDRRFLTLVKGVIVNMDYIIRIEDRNCYMQNGMTLPLHLKKKKELRETWLNYKFAKIRAAAPQGGEEPC
ncbi:MAG: response regulator transcription factor [Clostridia bacterium]|nr:response regulator transcription factor [Clostridia bacterium]